MLTVSDRSALFGGAPEWDPWRAFVEETLREAAEPAWETFVPRLAHQPQADAPLLANAVVSIGRATVVGFVHRLHDVLLARGTPALASAAAVFEDDRDALELFRASLGSDGDTIARIAERHAFDPDALTAVASLLPVAFLQACHRRLGARVNEGWSKAYCPVCGSWPAFAEVLSTDRARSSRCGRCGAAWPGEPLFCGFCGNRDHTTLVTLIPEGGDRQGAVEACTRCSSYMKTFTVLQPWPPLDVTRQDLASVAFDFAAIDQGYSRPGGTGYALHLAVKED